MKRRWLIGRMVLTVMMLCVTVLLFYYWPSTPRWRIAREQSLGFDLKQELLFTRNYLDSASNYELHGYNLRTGQRQIRLPIDLHEWDAKDHVRWEFLVSTDGNRLVCWNEPQQKIEVFSVHECRRLFSVKTGQICIDSIGLSLDGSLLAFRGYDDVQIWDCNTGKLKLSITMPKETTVGFRSGVWLCHPDRLQFSNDGRYLAIGGDHHVIVIFNVESGKVVGQCPKAWMPLFAPDNKTLLTFTDRFLSSEVNWYEIRQEKVLSLSRTLENDGNRVNVVDASNHRFFTGVHKGKSELTLPVWVPATIRKSAQSWLDQMSQNLFIKSWDIHSGKLMDEFQISFVTGLIVKLSPDGKMLTVEDSENLTLWDIPPRRSITCWLVCSCSALFAVWLAWPRKVKQL